MKTTASVGRPRGSEGEARTVSEERPTPLASLRLASEAAELEAALDRFRQWYRQRGAEEARLVAQLNHFRALTEKGVQKANALSAKLTGIRLKLQEQTQKETPHGDE